VGRAGCQKGAGGCEGDPVAAATGDLIELIYKRRRSDLFASGSFLYGGERGQRTAAMHGKLALYYPQYGVIPLVVSLLAIIWTTIFLTRIQTYLVTDDAEDLALAYLLPTIFIAVFFGSTLAVASSFASALAAAYFLYPPKLSFYIADPTHAAELGFILLLSVTASKAIGVMTDDRRR
jgi:K+-sensing histidine kinase KdpD